MKFVAILVCLTPTSDKKQITEYTFYQIINPISAVKNIKLISKNIPFKAFVQLENNLTTELVIDKLHDQVLDIGRVKIFKSHKTYIALEKTIKQILEEGSVHRDAENENCFQNRKSSESIDYKNKTKIQKNTAHMKNVKKFFDVGSDCDHKFPVGDHSFNIIQEFSVYNKTTKQKDSSNNIRNNFEIKEYCSEMITRGSKKLSSCQNSIYLTSKGLTRSTINEYIELVRPFSDIFDIDFDKKTNVLFIDFKSEDAAQEIIRKLNNSTFKKYKLIIRPFHVFSQLLESSLNSDQTEQFRIDTNVLTQDTREYNDTDDVIWGLEFLNPSSNFELEDFAKIIGRIVLPFSIKEVYCSTSCERMFIAYYRSKSLALGVLNQLKLQYTIDFTSQIKIITL